MKPALHDEPLHDEPLHAHSYLCESQALAQFDLLATDAASANASLQTLAALVSKLADPVKFLSEAANTFSRNGHHLSAELSAVLLIKYNPGRLDSYRLFSHVLRRAGHQDEAEVLFSFCMPAALVKKYFSSNTLVLSSSNDGEGVSKESLFSARKHPAKPPLQMHSNKLAVFSNPFLHEQNAYVTTLENGRLWFDGYLNTVVWDKAGAVVTDLCQGNPQIVADRCCDLTALTLTGKVCLLGNRNPDNYYHWMNDIVPKFGLLDLSDTDVASIDYFVLNSSNTTFQRETLGLLGIDKSKVLSSNNSPYLLCDELIVPKYGSNTLGMGQGKWAAEYLVNVFGTQSQTSKSRKLYISRGNRGARSIVNEDDVVAFLEKNGFETIHPEKYSVQEQARLFCEAKVVLGPHGAGLSNIAFCKSGTKIVELYCNKIAPTFWNTCQLHGFAHYAHQFSKGNPDSVFSEAESELFVCVKELGTLLEFIDSR